MSRRKKKDRAASGLGLRRAEIRLSLEQGISPDDLPINPPRKSPVSLEPGHYSYRRYKDGRMVREWFTIRNRESNEKSDQSDQTVEA